MQAETTTVPGAVSPARTEPCRPKPDSTARTVRQFKFKADFR